MPDAGDADASALPHVAGRAGDGSLAITIGTFDGAHRGHGALIAACRERVGEHGRVIAMAFDPHPASKLNPSAVPARLTTFEQRSALLRATLRDGRRGADEVVRLTPDDALLDLSPEAFVAQVCRAHRPAWWIEGADFHFGKGRAGSVRTLESLSASEGFRSLVVPGVTVALDDHLVVRASSTLVRWLLANGRVRDAGVVLGRWFEHAGEVVRGDQLGRTIGFRTLNIAGECVPPGDGVYAAWVSLPDGRSCPAAVNIGLRPTVRGGQGGLERRVEAHVMHPDGSPADLSTFGDYGWRATLRFVAWMRDQMRFDGLETLKCQLRRDTLRACRILRESHAIL